MAKRYFADFSKPSMVALSKKTAAKAKGTRTSGTARSGSKGSNMGNVG